MSKFLIIGCPRSGTTYTTTFFRQIGFDVKHEKMGKHGCIGWNYAIDKEFKKKGTRVGIKFTHILHQVRHPLLVMRSLPVTFAVRSEMKHIKRGVGKLCPDDLLIRCMQMWHKWNVLCEKQSILTYRVEDLYRGSKLTKKLSNMLSFNLNKVKDIDTKTNSKKKKKSYIKTLTWKMLEDKNKKLFKKIVEQTRRYGYEI